MKQSLQGLRILNTRPRKQAQTLSKEIEAAGGIAVECPTLEIEACETGWLSSLPDLEQVQHAIFVSPNAAHISMQHLRVQQLHWPSDINVIAVGHGTAKTLKEFNILVNAVPTVPDSEHLLAIKSLQALKDQTVLLFKGEEGRTLIEESLVQKGANLFSVPVYRRVMPQIDEQFMKALWHDDLVDIILLTSEQSMHNLFKMLGMDAHPWLQQKPCLVISQRIAEKAASLGIKKIILSHPERMLETLYTYVE
ncbi:uroporphyrinogen-III synthase [Legionella sp. 16cNR16C]|uniref:uroporphyrinogen-III synthase n=1 Tax=Legionella sp. 16cNR16C TaxID=2905656 RepID=UPI001E4BF42F|nr:uroporphyrinogen-III synthase [Legionella sp. 16cNR16C]MCE3046395.1 uroporphyrinogen-III synthase [Legionella sp. 16cNR16C]